MPKSRIITPKEFANNPALEWAYHVGWLHGFGQAQRILRDILKAVPDAKIGTKVPFKGTVAPVKLSARGLRPHK